MTVGKAGKVPVVKGRGALMRAQVRSLDPKAINIRELTDEQLRQLTHDQLRALSNDQLRALEPRVDVLTDKQVVGAWGDRCSIPDNGPMYQMILVMSHQVSGQVVARIITLQNRRLSL